MNKTPRTKEDNEAIEKWLKENKVTVCEPHAHTDPNDIEYTFKVGKRGRPAK